VGAFDVGHFAVHLPGFLLGVLDVGLHDADGVGVDENPGQGAQNALARVPQPGVNALVRNQQKQHEQRAQPHAQLHAVEDDVDQKGQDLPPEVHCGAHQADQHHAAGNLFRLLPLGQAGVVFRGGKKSIHEFGLIS
jgi:hypothetical protein